MAFNIWDDLLNWLLGHDKGHGGNGNGNQGSGKGRKVGVPEPATLALILVGLAGVEVIRHRRKAS
jgi:hypothetical protein